MALCGKLALEGATDVSSDTSRNDDGDDYYYYYDYDDIPDVLLGNAVRSPL
jgi:hypothetical protein